MQDRSTEHRDHNWDLALEIASKLWYDGEYTFATDPDGQQRLVDVHWAALQAGRILGVRSRVRVRGPGSRADPMITVTVTFDDPDGRVRVRASERFGQLLESVRREERGQ